MKIRRQQTEEEEIINELKEEWKYFEIPVIIHERIRELFWEHREEEETIKILISDFDMKRCFAFKCYYYSDANLYNRDRYEKIGMFLDCRYCTDDCVPQNLK